ncbi:MAG: CocE/NonD family hydrolase [Pseudomonadota bacterium]
MDLPFTDIAGIEDMDHVAIPMPDGTVLAARLWRPTSAHAKPVPVLFEAIPYRKADMVRARDERNHPFFAANGYACLRVDMRGSGDSGGHMDDMYTEDEQSDVRHVIAWIVDQPWCNGSVGMFGTSWGGTASLQAAVSAHPALKAVIAVCATHDRYEDDIHHKGGCLITDSIEWGATLPAILALPPTPAVGPQWLALWRERLDHLPFPLERWVAEEARGAYWRHGSVRHRWDDLTVPVLAIGGWADRYSNSVMSLVDARPDLAWGVVGPWGHHYPDQGKPGPAMGFQTLALEWWNAWLKDGTPLDWPKLKVWLGGFDPPHNALETRQGGWIATPPAGKTSTPRTFVLKGEGALAAHPSADDEDARWTVPLDLAVGASGGDTGYFGRHGGRPLDQCAEDQLSLVFQTEPLEEDLILYGAANVVLSVDVPDPPPQLAIRLNELAADGSCARVCLSLLNLALDADLDAPAAPQPSERRTITIAFHSTAHRFTAGHRIRLAISASYWPMAWPAPGRTTATVRGGTLTLPVLNGDPDTLRTDVPPAVEMVPHSTITVVDAPEIVRHAFVDGDSTRHQGWHQPRTTLHYSATNTAFSYETSADHSIDPGEPLSATSRFDHALWLDRPDGTAHVRAHAAVHADAHHYYLSGEVLTTWNGEVVGHKTFNPTVPRRLS